jgi:hypothetical protein
MDFVKENLGQLIEAATAEVINELADNVPELLAGSASASLDSATGVPLTTGAKVLLGLTRKALQNKQDLAIQAEVVE